MTYFKNHESGDIISRFSQDCGNIEGFVMTAVVSFIKDPLKVIGALYYLITTKADLTLYIIILAPIFVLIIKLIGERIKKIAAIVQEKISGVISYLQQTLFGIELIKVFSNEERIKDTFKNKNADYLKYEKKALKLTSLNKPLIEFIGGISLIIAVSIGAFFAVKNEITIGELIAYFFSITFLSQPINNIGDLYIWLKKTSASAERVFEIIDLKSEVIHEKNKKDIENIEGIIEYRNVNFSYNKDKQILHNISFKVKKGQLIAFVGGSGGGKTTLVNLLPRLFTLNNGEIFIDGNNINNIRLDSLRKQISIVTQETILFPGTIKENILFAKINATDEEIIQSCKDANAYNFIMSFKDKFETQIGERGIKLSGGQKQRIALARAIIRKPAIMILDEATSALDTESERLVQDALNKIMKHQTTFVIAHRLSTIQHSDKIIVLDKGKIVEMGTHKKLLEKKGYFKRLHDLQFT
jgi:subfamily B ATP-binding cassette protein MsbA